MIAPVPAPRHRRVRADTIPPPLEEWDVIERRVEVENEEEMARHPVVIALADLVMNDLKRKAVVL